MYKNIVFIICSFLFSGELEVDGDLKVTGNIQNQMIDSLLQVISDLQNQLSLLQGGVETRMFIYDYIGGDLQMNIDISEITGYDLSIGHISLLNFEIISGFVDGINQYDKLEIEHDGGYGGNISIIFHPEYKRFYHHNGGINVVPENTELYFRTNFTTSTNDIVRLTLIITSQFPSESNTLLKDNSVLTKDKNGQ